MTAYMDRHAEILILWLMDRHRKDPELRYQIGFIAIHLGWTETQVKHAIAHARSQYDREDSGVLSEQRGDTWYYKFVGTAQEGEDYAIQRCEFIVTLLSNVLFLVRKNRSLFGELRYFIAMEDGLRAILVRMYALGVPNALDALDRAMRPIRRRNGQSPITA
jgi:hypothetical protein